MRGFFKIDGPFFKYGTILADVIILTFLWAICSCLIVTIGLSTTALFYVATKQTSNKEGYITSNFFRSIKENFLQGIISTIILLVAGFVIYVSIRFAAAVPNMREIILTLDYIAAFEVIIISVYIFPLMARFDMKLIELFKTAFFLANRHMVTTISCLILIVAIFLLCIFVNPVFIIAGVGAYAYISSFMFMRIFKKYCPDIDVDEPDLFGQN